MLGNGKTLKLNPGDVLKVSISDPPSGLTTGWVIPQPGGAGGAPLSDRAG